MSCALLVGSRCAWSEAWNARGVSFCKWIANARPGPAHSLPLSD